MAPLLEDRTSAITLFAPTNDAWACVSPRVDLGDRETLQEVLLFLIAQVRLFVLCAGKRAWEGIGHLPAAPAAPSLEQTPASNNSIPCRRPALPAAHRRARSWCPTRASCCPRTWLPEASRLRSIRSRALRSRCAASSSPLGGVGWERRGVGLARRGWGGTSRLLTLRANPSPLPPPQVLAGPQGIALQDGSSLTPDAIVVNANNVVCSGQVVNFVDQVPLPGWRP